MVHILSKVKTRLPTTFGNFNLWAFSCSDKKDHLALEFVPPETESHLESTPLVRIHSECLTGDVFGSLRCDCQEQLHMSLKQIASHKRGTVIYLRQEGRGIGLLEKLKAYNLQDMGQDTVDANITLGHEVDSRDFSIAATILKELNMNTVKLLTNNPNKTFTLKKCGISVEQTIAIETKSRPENRKYLETKKNRLGHTLKLIKEE